jgi:imidazolonepropionase-like amidohydrolase
VTLLIRGGQIWLGREQGFVSDHALVVRGAQIADVVPEAALPGEHDGPAIDAGGLFLLPGLVDAHCHLMVRSTADPDEEHIAAATLDAARCAGQLVHAGVTTVRDVGSRTQAIHALKRAIAARELPGPRTFAAGPNITGSGAPREWRNTFADGPEAIRRSVREQYRAGADLIKLVLSHAPAADEWRRTIRFLGDEEIAAAVAEAHALGLRTGCHCEGVEAARGAVAAGMDVIDHGIGLDAELVREMAERGTWLVPTLRAFSTEGVLEAGSICSAVADLYEQRVARVHRESFQLAVAAGVPIAAGSDPQVLLPPVDNLVREAEAMHRAGLSRAAVIDALTAGGAAALGREGELGTLAAGFTADVVGVTADPLADLRALAAPELVIQDGELVCAQSSLKISSGSSRTTLAFGALTT